MSQLRGAGKEVREKLFHQVVEMLRAQMVTPNGDVPVTVTLSRGIERRADYGDQMWKHEYNGSLTITVEINGGARDTEREPTLADYRG